MAIQVRRVVVWCLLVFIDASCYGSCGRTCSLVSSFTPLPTTASSPKCRLPVSSSVVVNGKTPRRRVRTDVKCGIAHRQEEETMESVNPRVTRAGPPAWMRCINGVAPRTGSLNEMVATLADVSLETANELIGIGAVWAKIDVLTREGVLSQYHEGEDGRAEVSYSDLPKGWGSGDQYGTNDGGGGEEDADLDEYVVRMGSRRYRRIMTPSSIDAGTDLRIYPHPRRFPACHELDATRLLYEDTTFIVVDKPPMLPTQPDASNYLECCPGCVHDILGPFTTIAGERVRRPLLCHRVDSCVGGCVVLSKDGNGQRVFSQFQRERKIKKIYLTLTTKPVPLGMHIHWMWAPLNNRGQIAGPPCQLLSHTPPVSRKKAKSWIRCVLEVSKCEPIDVVAANGGDYDPIERQYYQSTVRLVTGRKHQVRAQLASLGCPVIRDTLYEPIAGRTLDTLESDEGEVETDLQIAVDRCRVPTHPIGLQAHAILFGTIHTKATTPWWGDGSRPHADEHDNNND